MSRTRARLRADLLHVTPDAEDRGRDIQRRRVSLGISSATRLAELAGVDRKAVYRAEAGEASDNTYIRLESYLDQHEVAGSDVQEEQVIEAHTGEGLEVIRVTITGPHAEWKVESSGPPGDGDEVTRMAVEAARRLQEGEGAS